VKRIASLGLIAFAIGCAKNTPPDTGAAPREVRELRKGDPALRPISFAAASYLRSMTTGPEVGFIGAFHRRELDVELTRDIVIRHAFVDLSRGGKTTDGCEGPPISIPTSVQPPRDPARPGTATPPPPTTTASPTQAPCGTRSSSGARTAYGFHKYRVASDTAYVETSGLAQGGCMVLTVQPTGGWGVLTVKSARPEACGR
jgi:hypothetical protein